MIDDPIGDSTNEPISYTRFKDMCLKFDETLSEATIMYTFNDLDFEKKGYIYVQERAEFFASIFPNAHKDSICAQLERTLEVHKEMKSMATLHKASIFQIVFIAILVILQDTFKPLLIELSKDDEGNFAYNFPCCLAIGFFLLSLICDLYVVYIKNEQSAILHLIRQGYDQNIRAFLCTAPNAIGTLLFALAILYADVDTVVTCLLLDLPIVKLLEMDFRDRSLNPMLMIICLLVTSLLMLNGASQILGMVLAISARTCWTINNILVTNMVNAMKSVELSPLAQIVQVSLLFALNMVVLIALSPIVTGEQVTASMFVPFRKWNLFCVLIATTYAAGQVAIMQAGLISNLLQATSCLCGSLCGMYSSWIFFGAESISLKLPLTLALGISCIECVIINSKSDHMKELKCAKALAIDELEEFKILMERAPSLAVLVVESNDAQDVKFSKELSAMRRMSRRLPLNV